MFPGRSSYFLGVFILGMLFFGPIQVLVLLRKGCFWSVFMFHVEWFHALCFKVSLWSMWNYWISGFLPRYFMALLLERFLGYLTVGNALSISSIEPRVWLVIFWMIHMEHCEDTLFWLSLFSRGTLFVRLSGCSLQGQLFPRGTRFGEDNS